MEEHGIEGVTFLSHEVFRHLDSGLSQDPRAFAADQGIGVSGTDDDFCQLVFYDGLCAGRGFAVVTAGLQSDVDGRAFWIVAPSAAVGQSVALRVELAASLVIAHADDLSVLYDDRAYHRVGAGIACASGRQFDGHFHVF